MRSLRKNILLLVLLFLTTSCAVVDIYSVKVPGSDLDEVNTFYVIRHDKDTRNLDITIAEELNKLGFNATSGFIDEKPDNVDAVVTYHDRWIWDLSLYLLQLEIQIRDSETNFPLIKGESFRTSMARKSPAVMAQEIFESMFGSGEDVVK